MAGMSMLPTSQSKSASNVGGSMDFKKEYVPFAPMMSMDYSVADPYPSYFKSTYASTCENPKGGYYALVRSSGNIVYYDMTMPFASVALPVKDTSDKTYMWSSDVTRLAIYKDYLYILWARLSTESDSATYYKRCIRQKLGKNYKYLNNKWEVIGTLNVPYTSNSYVDFAATEKGLFAATIRSNEGAKVWHMNDKTLQWENIYTESMADYNEDVFISGFKNARILGENEDTIILSRRYYYNSSGDAGAYVRSLAITYAADGSATASNMMSKNLAQMFDKNNNKVNIYCLYEYDGDLIVFCGPSGGSTCNYIRVNGLQIIDLWHPMTTVADFVIKKKDYVQPVLIGNKIILYRGAIYGDSAPSDENIYVFDLDTYESGFNKKQHFPMLTCVLNAGDKIRCDESKTICYYKPTDRLSDITSSKYDVLDYVDGGYSVTEDNTKVYIFGSDDFAIE